VGDQRSESNYSHDVSLPVVSHASFRMRSWYFDEGADRLRVLPDERRGVRESDHRTVVVAALDEGDVYYTC